VFVFFRSQNDAQENKFSFLDKTSIRRIALMSITWQMALWALDLYSPLDQTAMTAVRMAKWKSCAAGRSCRQACCISENI
jgi:hypothetical protein